MRVALTHNLRRTMACDLEYDIKPVIDELRRTLSVEHDVVLVETSGPTKRWLRRLLETRSALVFNIAEGCGVKHREAIVPTVCEMFLLPYTGSDPHVVTLTLDKAVTKAVAAELDIQTPRYRFVSSRKDVSWARFPAFVKPNFEGSSKGVTPRSVCRNRGELKAVASSTLRRYPHGVLIEEFVSGYDATVPYLERYGVLSPLRVELPDDQQVYSSKLKSEASGGVRYVRLTDDELASRLQAHTRALVERLGVRDLCRVDFRVTPDRKIYFLEMNALPSLEHHAGPGREQAKGAFAVAMEHVGMSHRDALAAVVHTARTRWRI